MSLIKFPTQINPSRVTVNLQRTDEMFQSPVTGIQQVASRGTAFWRWTYEFRDLSLSERETVQAFLAKCRGSLNTFKVTDHANYEIRGSVSDWIDVYSEYGTFNVTAGSSNQYVNSHFIHSVTIAAHITDEQTVAFEWRKYESTGNLGVPPDYIVNSFTEGKAYVQRIKQFHGKAPNHNMTFRVGSGAGAYLIQSAPWPVYSADCITAPFYVGETTSGYTVLTVERTDNVDGASGKWKYADYRLARCALVSNSENLLRHSNDFGGADWTLSNATVDSGYGDKSPTGVTSGSWKLYCNANVNTTHYITQSITKNSSEDIYTASIYAKAIELSDIRIVVGDNLSASYASALFRLNSGTITNINLAGNTVRPSATIWPVDSGYYRCQMTAVVGSTAQVSALFQLADPALAFTGNGSDGIEIMGAQVRQFPFMGHYVETTSPSLIGTNWQTGSNLYVDGLDSEDIIKAGTRIEVVNRFHQNSLGLFERSEFKKLTEEVVVNREGSVVLPIDPPIRNAPVTARSWRQQSHLGETMHNPVIFDNPEMKARLVGGTIQYIEKPLQMTDIVFDIIEDLSE